MSSWWADITDSASAKGAALNGVVAAAIFSTFTTIAAIVSMSLGHSVMGIDAAGLVDAALFGVVAWRIYRMSRPWAVVGLCLYLFEIGFKLFHGGLQSGGVFVALFMTTAFVNGIRGVFKFHEYAKASPLPSSTESIPAI
jgi:hypothetical protein